MSPEQRSQATHEVAPLKPWERIHVRMSLLYGAVVVLVLLSTGIAMYQRAVGSVQDELRTRALNVAQLLAHELSSAQLMSSARSRASGEGIARRLGVSQEDIRHAFAINRPGDEGILSWVFQVRLAEDHRAEPAPLPPPEFTQALQETFAGEARADEAIIVEGRLVLPAYAPVPDQPTLAAGVYLDASSLAVVRERTLTLLITGFALAVALLLAITLVVGRQVSAPFEQLLRASEALSQGAMDVPVDQERRDELGLLAARFNQMAADLKQRQFMQETFGRYLSEDITKVLSSDPRAVRLGGELREVTIMFADLRGYSTVSERLTPTEVVELVNAYMTVMHEAVVAHGGSVIEYQGDGVLATFGAPVRRDDHAELGVRCALGIESRLGQLKAELASGRLGERLAEVGVTALESRVGLHTGTVVAGNLGSPAHMKYGVIGDAVNVSARLEALNKELGTKVLLSDKTYQRLPVELRNQARVQGVRHVKGRAQPVGVFSMDMA